jgi:hypothetical protein
MYDRRWVVVCCIASGNEGMLLWLQVFHSLLKAHAAEAKAVVKQALDILTPAMPLRMEDGHVSVSFLLLLSLPYPML